MDKLKIIGIKLLGKWRNKYVIISAFFLPWMIFFDTNSWLNDYQHSRTVKQLEEAIEYYEKEIAKDQKALQELSNPKTLEKFAREKYYMKKDNDDIYIIEKK